MLVFSPKVCVGVKRREDELRSRYHADKEITVHLSRAVRDREGVAMPAPPSRQEVRERLASLIKEIANIPTDHIGDNATVDGELQMNSVAFVELQVAIEEDYDIQIDPVRVVELNQFGAIVDYVHQCVSSVAR